MELRYRLEKQDLIDDIEGLKLNNNVRLPDKLIRSFQKRRLRSFCLPQKRKTKRKKQPIQLLQEHVDRIPKLLFANVVDQ